MDPKIWLPVMYKVVTVCREISRKAAETDKAQYQRRCTQFYTYEEPVKHMVKRVGTSRWGVS